MRLFLIDDQVMFRQGLKSLLERSGSYLVSGESKSAVKAIPRIQDCGVDMILIDSNTRRGDSLPATVETLKEIFPEVRVLVVSRHVDPLTVRETLAVGADGFLPKTADCSELFRALKLLEEGGCFIHYELLGCVVDEFRNIRRAPPPEWLLTEKERHIIELVSEGLNNKEIGEEVSASESSVKSLMRGLFRKFNVRDRTRLVVEAMNRGVLSSWSHRRKSNVS